MAELPSHHKVLRVWVWAAILAVPLGVGLVMLGGVTALFGILYLPLFPWILGIGPATTSLLWASRSHGEVDAEELSAARGNALLALILAALAFTLWRSSRGHMLPFVLPFHAIAAVACGAIGLALLWQVRRISRLPRAAVAADKRKRAPGITSRVLGLVLALVFTIILPMFSGGHVNRMYVSEMRNDLDRVVEAQDAHWRRHRRFASTMADLGPITPSEGVTITLEEDDSSSWFATARHEKARSITCSVRNHVFPEDSVPRWTFVDCRESQ